MILSVSVVLVLAAFVVTLAAALGKAPIWVAVLLLVVLHLVALVPIR
jgi:hypothetical protein